MTSSLGLSLKLSPEAIASLQSRSTSTVTPPSHSDTRLDENASSIDENYEDDEIAVSLQQQQDGEDWDDTIAVHPNYLQEVDSADNDDVDRVNVDDDDSKSDGDDEIFSLAPPPSLPLVVVNLERLCGFVPSTPEEAEQLRQQVVTALSHDNDGGNGDTTDEQQEDDEHDSLSRHFDSRVKELFENGVANHGDTTAADDENDDFSRAVISYPEFLCRRDPTPSVMVTAREWKKLLKSHDIVVVNKLLQHLKDCNQPLSWKADMHSELLNLVKREESHRNSQQEEAQLHYWRTERRKQQLDKLYQVRETFDHRLQVATEKLEELELKRDKAARNELRSMRLSQGESAGGLEALDFDTNIFSFGHDTMANKNDTIERGEDDFDGGDGSTDSGYDEDRRNASDDSVSVDKGDNVDSNAVADSALPAVDDKERSRARRKAAQKAHQRRLQSQQEAAKEQSRIEQALAEEERVRDACATPELKMAQATVKSLEERMQQVDDLLESLQEEEWADEEEGILQTEAEAIGNNVTGRTAPSTTPDSNEFSLLDSVLAMILGTLPQSPDTKPEDHYKFIRKEHQDIVNEWKEYFGRLPVSFQDSDEIVPPLVAADILGDEIPEAAKPKTRVTAAELRESLGIADNVDQDNWDDVDDWDSLVANENSATSPTKKKSVVGLRPGGKVSR